jgi:hypothetical protein
MQTRSVVITRRQFGQLGSVLLGLGGLIALTAFIWSLALNEFVVSGLVIGALGAALWAAMTPQEFKAFFTGRQVQRSTGAIFTTLLLTAIVVVFYIIVQRAVIVSDLTIDRRFTLTEQTLDLLQVVERSPRPLRILGFYRPQDLLQREIDDAYWQLYEAASNGMITRQYVDPLREPGIAAPFSQALAANYYVFVGFVNPDGTLDLSTVTPVSNQATQERSMTEAIARVLAGGSFKVYFEQGLQTLDALSNSQQGMSILNNNLRANGIITDALRLSDLAQSGRTIPRDASALIIARPQRDMTEAELAVVREYVERGGTLFIAADFFPTADVFLSADSPFNAYLWETFGLRMTDAVVVDTRSPGPSALHVVSAQVVTENVLTAGLNQPNDPSTATMFHMARAIEVNPQPPVPNGTVIFSSEQSWGETDTRAIVERNEFIADPNTDLRGPLSLVAFAENPATGARIVLVGDGEFLTNGYTSAQSQFYATGNATLFMNSIGWLTGFAQEVAFTPRAFMTTPVLFSGGQQLDVIAFITVFVMPGTMLLIAGLIYWRRYRTA